MNKYLIITLLVSFGITVGAFAQTDGAKTGSPPEPVDDFEVKLGSIKNPFKSQLPVEEEPEEDYEVPEAPKETLKPQQPASSGSGQPPEQPGIPKPRPQEPANAPATPVVQEPVLPPLPDITISGTVWNSDRPQAIINGYVVDVGSTISGILITDIQKNEIKGSFQGVTITINNKGARYEQ